MGTDPLRQENPRAVSEATRYSKYRSARRLAIQIISVQRIAASEPMRSVPQNGTQAKLGRKARSEVPVTLSEPVEEEGRCN